MLPYFRSAEDNERGADDWHGAGGPLGVSDLRDRHPLAMPSSKRRSSAAIRAMTISTARRRRAWAITRPRRARRALLLTAVGYLGRCAIRTNLQSSPDALATRILFDGRRAIGVRCSANRRPPTVTPAEVIVAAGAFNSPQLLQLSGLGPAELLRRIGIPVVADLPGVGDDPQRSLLRPPHLCAAMSRSRSTT